MKLLRILTLVTVLSLTPCAFAEPHGNLHDASEALHRAQTSQSVEDLHTAQHALEAAVAYAKSQKVPVAWGVLKRKDALDQVGQALEALQAGDKVRAGKSIEQALKLTDEAVSISPKKK